MKLWIRLFFACGALSLATLAGFAAWQQATFTRGFDEYLEAQAAERMQQAAARLAVLYADRGRDWDFLRDDPMMFGAIVDPRAPNPRPREPGAAPTWPPRGEAGPPGARPGRPDLMMDAGPRIGLYDAEGRHVAGTRDAPAEGPGVPVELGGRTVGMLRAVSAPVPGGLEQQFAQRQARHALGAAAVVLLLSLGVAFALARWLLGPVRALADGTRALAAGDYGLRVPVEGRDELSALAQDFNRLAATLEQHRAARQRWGADIAHELRTPLAVQRVELQTLIDGVRRVTPDALASLMQECERLSALTDDLYQLALADTGALEYRFERLDLVDIAGDADLRHQATLAQAGLVLDTQLPEVAVALRGDRIRLGQLVDNLLTNARRYTDAPGRIALAVRAEGSHALLVVDDSPPGVDDGALADLFERNVRGPRSRDHDGAGLGLAIVRAIAEAHDGHVAACASPLGGLRVTVTLPLARSTA
jgi:two-component system sensor histidine kinase BaeS